MLEIWIVGCMISLGIIFVLKKKEDSEWCILTCLLSWIIIGIAIGYIVKILEGK